MALATIKGTFISAALKKSEFDGKVNYSTQVDVYQADSPRNDKMVSVKVDDAELLSKFQDTYKMGDVIDLQVLISSYKNQTYYKFLNFA